MNPGIDYRYIYILELHKKYEIDLRIDHKFKDKITINNERSNYLQCELQSRRHLKISCIWLNFKEPNNL